MQYTQLSKESTHQSAIWGLLASFLEESAFEYLRSQHQLGYVANA